MSCAHIHNQRRANNRHERFNATLRELLFGRRGRLTEAVIMAAWLYYNYFRPHMALGKTTPAEKAGMTIVAAIAIRSLAAPDAVRSRLNGQAAVNILPNIGWLA